MNLKQIREDLHRIPEIAFDVYKTKEYIMNLFKDKDLLEIKTFDFNGIVMFYKHGGEKPFTLFRADMDALPIREKTCVDFESEHENQMHACGHDIHMTVLIGLIDRVLTMEPKKNLVFVFQPGEEGHGGALKIINSGVFDGINIKECYALHVSPKLPVGTVASKAGIIFGIPQEFDVVFKGESTHIATPQLGKDALLAGIQFYSTMKQLIPQSLNPVEATVFQIGKMEAGVVRNSIAETCLMQGTHRTLTMENRDTINKIMNRVAKSTAEAHGLKHDVKILGSFDPVVNDEDLYNKFKDKVIDCYYKFNECEYTMTGEDFGFFTTYYKGLLFWLGSGDMENSLHSDKFLPKQECVEVGVDIMWKLI
jgi:N-acetyldiaminopimelate deacetylase